MNTDGTTGRASKGTIVIDLDGVVYLGTEGVAGAGEALATLETAGWHLVFATNNSTKTPRDVKMHIEERTGFRSSDAVVVTSALAAASWTARDHSSALVVGEPAVSEALSATGVDVVESGPAEAVVVGLDRNITYDTIAAASHLIRSGATFVATNTDATFPTPDGPVPGAGSVVAAIAVASGTAPVACGKPEAPMLDLVRSAVRGPQVWVVGDRPETDIAMALKAGWNSVLVRTGITAPGEPVDVQHTPGYSVGSIVDVPALIV
ncbi:MAG: TIGR01457 family HAD-type hydrolase [Acidimicrobiia bacterium]|nr:MAG: TIGR01457 family HAD-type hydrolase [Acidimicrobiia bacterium]